MAYRNHRMRYLLAGIVLAGVSASAIAETPDSAVQDLPRNATENRPAAAASGERIDSLSLDRLKRARINVKKSSTFAAKSWYVPTPTPKPTPTPPPSAPPLPFTYLGKLQEPEGKLTFFLSEGTQVRLVSAGEIINDTYSVDGVENSRLVLTYLPLRIKQYLNVGDTP